MNYKDMILKGINFKVNQYNYKHIDNAINDILIDIDSGVLKREDVMTDRLDNAIMMFSAYCIVNNLECEN